MELRFDAILPSKLGNENSDVGRIWPAGRRFPTLDVGRCIGLTVDEYLDKFIQNLKENTEVHFIQRILRYVPICLVDLNWCKLT